MARFNIIDALTGAVKYSGAPKYNGVYCKPSYLEFTEIASPVPVDWKVGDYVVYSRTGMTYRLYDIPQPKKQSRRTEYGGAFVYQNVQFFADTKWLELTPFRDIVIADNAIHFTSQQSWSVWTNVESLIGRLQATMDALYPNEWEFTLVDAEEGTALYILLHDNYQDFQISGESVLEGLEKIYSLWENIGWMHTVSNGKNVITIGYPAVRIGGIGSDTEQYAYGTGNGLLSIKKSQLNKGELKTRIYVYGSTRNMPTRYYNNLIPHIKDYESVYIPNLMLPVSSWGSDGDFNGDFNADFFFGSGVKDASKAYLENLNAKARYGLRPAVVYFDGSEQEEIYPTIGGMTAKMLRDAMESGTQYRPSSTKWPDAARVDEVVSQSGIADNGVLNNNGQKYQVSETVAIESQSGNIQASAGTDSTFDIDIIPSRQATVTGDLTVSVVNFMMEFEDTHIDSMTAYMSVASGDVVRDYELVVAETRTSVIVYFNGELPRLSVNEGDSLSVKIKGTIKTATAGTIAWSMNESSVQLNYSYIISKNFTLRIPQIGFDITQRASLGSEGYATLSMRDGKCGGRSFVVSGAVYNSTEDAWDLQVARTDDESLGMRFPNTTYPIEAGDHFVLLDIAMPDIYVKVAELRLEEAGEKYLADVSRVKPFYEPEIDAKYMVENDRILREGMYFKISDPDIIGSEPEYILIDTLTISENESNIPTYRATLREQKRTNNLSYAKNTGETFLVSRGNGSVTTYVDTKGSEGGSAYFDSGNFYGNVIVEGKVGVGVPAPIDKLEVDGNIKATGQITPGQASDERLKDNIINLRNAVAMLSAMRPVEFDWNNLATSLCGENRGHDFGLVAQELLGIMPGAVGRIFGEYLKINYEKIIPLLVAGWQANNERLNRIENELKK